MIPDDPCTHYPSCHPDEVCWHRPTPPWSSDALAEAQREAVRRFEEITGAARERVRGTLADMLSRAQMDLAAANRWNKILEAQLEHAAETVRIATDRALALARERDALVRAGAAPMHESTWFDEWGPPIFVALATLAAFAAVILARGGLP